ncbi:MAG: hypothetical protein HDS65_00420 [Bacteroidales bacterium]|nr:hypothetical protein [Bacteroidales bacterium]
MRCGIVIFLLTAVAALGYGAEPAAKATLARLDGLLNKRNLFIEERQHRIDSLVDIGNRSSFTPTLLMEVADAYTSFNNDSALYYLQLGIDSSKGSLRDHFLWKHAACLPLAGLNDLAVKEYNSIDPESIPPELLSSYYDSGRQMHSYIVSFFEGHPHISVQHEREVERLQKELIAVLPKESAEYKYNLGEYNLLTGKREAARILLEEIIESEPENSKLRARAAYHLSTIARANGDVEKSAYYLGLSAISDISSATRDVLSLQELGKLLYSQGKVNEAYRCISSALANAVECGAPLRMIDTARSLPFIETAHAASISTWRSSIYWVLGLISCLTIGLIASLFVLRHEMKKMERLQASLKAANDTKEVYISQFLQLCSIYMDKLNQFCKIAARKLAAGQADELYRMTKSGKFVEEQSREFYEVFDNAFLHIYPDFINQVNELLDPDKQITLKEGELLNTDLRILAFMRLGIEESSRIAQVLNLSLNTIYAYRNRLKAKAVDRENFEQNVMNISSVS